MWTRKTPKQNIDGIAALEAAQIGGIEQWLLLRGANRRHPVLLFLHGGPGAAQIAFARQDQAGLEERFVVVNWDQRGAGLSYSKRMPRESLHLEQLPAWLHRAFELSERYFEHLEAPDKQWLWFENSAHSPNVEQSEQFTRFVLDTVQTWGSGTK